MKTKKGRIRKVLLAGALAVIWILLIYRVNRGIEKTPLNNYEGVTFERGVVTEIIRDNYQEETGVREGKQVLMVRMLTGTHKGEEMETTSSNGMLFGAACTVGMHVILMQSESGSGKTVITTVYTQDREIQTYIFAALYIAALILIGGWKGMKGAVALIYTVVTVIGLYLPLVYRGYSPFYVAVFICAITTVVTMLLIGGRTLKTLAAIIGTVAGVVMAGAVARLFGLATGLSGWNVSNIETLVVLWDTDGVRVSELLFAGLLISTLGAVMDVAMSISSAMEEVLHQNPKLSRHELWKSGMRIGRDLMGTDSNTLILAFAGGSMSTLVLDYAYDLPYRQIINSNNIGLSIMQGLSGSFGVVLAVPMTVTFASFLYKTIGKKTAAAESALPAGIVNLPAAAETGTPEEAANSPAAAGRTAVSQEVQMPDHAALPAADREDKTVGKQWDERDEKKKISSF